MKMVNDSKKLWLQLDEKIKGGNQALGRYTAQAYQDDPSALAFITSRYKFCAKILSRMNTVLEIGCGDGFGSALVAQRIKRVICTDINKMLLEDNRSRMANFANIEYVYHDFRDEAYPEKVDGIYLVDVIEHIFKEEEDAFLKHLCASLTENGVCVIGTPNETSEKYASPFSREGHVNLKRYEDLDEIGRKCFRNHFIFGMNDEVVHTGFPEMAHFHWLIGVTPVSN